MGQRDNAGAADNRRAPRKSVARSAVVVYGERHHTVSATVENISSSGALISLRPEHALPETVFLIDIGERLVYQCAVAHHAAGKCGLRFLNRHPLAQLPPGLNYLAVIWLEFARH